jgi:phosphotriesterase-related protein
MAGERQMQVMSVTGPVDEADLGRVLVHEHITIDMPGQELDPSYAPDIPEIVARSVDQLQKLRELGVGAIVDPCPIELGRDPELYAEVSEKSGVKIVFATGFYMEASGIPYYWRARDADEIAEFYLSEITNGVGSTGLRPGVIKAATGLDASPLERRVLAGAARAQAQGGVAIITHTENSRHGDVQQAIFAENGADPSRIMIGHQDEQKSAAPIAALAAKGTFVGIDRIGLESLASDDHRADMVAELIRGGHRDKVCLSQDCVCNSKAAKVPFALSSGAKITVGQFLANMKPMTHVLTTFADKLRERGVTEEDLDVIFRDNPRRLLTGAN